MNITVDFLHVCCMRMRTRHAVYRSPVYSWLRGRSVI